ncbi:MAG: hypothetical protein FWD60_01540 [Candidatus Azobacteroides sp.]|nr:hypothetical protein [Candidatus Azobacteroides sp.]
MRQIFYLIAIVITMYFAFKVMAKVKDRPEEEKKKAVKPEKEIPNDKIILVENVNREQIEHVLQDFCELYNDSTEYAVLPRLTSLSESRFAITFPYNDALEVICYLVNYLNYPAEIKWNAVVCAWATVEDEPSWKEESDLLGKKIMLYVSPEKENSREYTEIITSENASYRINLNSIVEKDDYLEKQYVAPEIQPEDLEGKEFYDFE